jgi:hypothetical protein
MNFSNSKIYVTPNAIHVTKFANKYAYGFTRKPRTKRSGGTNQSPRDSLRSAYRSKKQVRLILEANADPATFERTYAFSPLFVTLTFAENITDLKRANREFKKFIQRLNYQLAENQLQGFGTALKYLVVPEFQKRGAVHYHIIFFKFPKQEDTNELLNSVWGHGFTFNKTINSVDHLKNYVTKYFVKNALDPRLKGKKHYFCSRNLGRPVLLREQTNNEAIISVLKDPEYQNSYSSNGEEITYSIFQNSPLIPYIYFKKEKAKPQLPPKQTEINFNEHHTRQSRRNTKTK